MEEERKLRVAIAVFDDAATLERALGEFKALGLGLHEFTVLTDNGALSDQLETLYAPEASNLEPDAPQLIIRNREVKGPENLPPSARHVSWERVIDFESWITSRLSEELNQRLARGSCALIVPITTALEERNLSQILLSYSASPVQIHDLAVRKRH